MLGMAKETSFRFRPRYVILAFVLTFFILGGVYLSQQTKLESIDKEKAELQAELDTLSVEVERLERMLEYMQTDEYLVQYCREKLGYVFPDDVKFYEDTPSSAAGTVAGSPTPEPTPEPTPQMGVYATPEIIMPQ